MTAPHLRTRASWRLALVFGPDQEASAREGRGESVPTSALPHNILKEWWQLLPDDAVSEARDPTPVPPRAHTTPLPTGGNKFSARLTRITNSDAFSIYRADDCIDQIDAAKFVSKFDLLKGY